MRSDTDNGDLVLLPGTDSDGNVGWLADINMQPTKSYTDLGMALVGTGEEGSGRAGIGSFLPGIDAGHPSIQL